MSGSLPPPQDDQEATASLFAELTLLPAGEIDSCGYFGWYTPLHEYLTGPEDPTWEKAGPKLRRLLDEGHDPNARDRFGDAPIHDAVRASSFAFEKTRLLLERGARVDVCNGLGQTPLHIAALQGRWEVLLLLLETGGFPDARDKKRMTPLHCTALGSTGRLPRQGISARLLLKAGADPLAGDNYGRIPLQCACREGSVPVVRALLAAGSPPNTLAANGQDTLQMVVIDNWPDVKGDKKATLALLLASPDLRMHPDDVHAAYSMGAWLRVRFRELLAADLRDLAACHRPEWVVMPGSRFGRLMAALPAALRSLVAIRGALLRRTRLPAHCSCTRSWPIRTRIFGRSVVSPWSMVWAASTGDGELFQ